MNLWPHRRHNADGDEPEVLWPQLPRTGGGSWRAPGLRVRRHRATTRHLCSLYPCQTEQGLGHAGVYLGTNVAAGGAGWCFDPFQLYTDGHITSPNMLILGEVGAGKSSAVKTFLYRSLMLSSPAVAHRWCAVLDPKGEYRPLADALDLDVIKLHPGGTTRLNPLDPGPGGYTAEDTQVRRTTLLCALAAKVLGRTLTPVEDAVLGWITVHIGHRITTPTLIDVANALHDPPGEVLDVAGMDAETLRRETDGLRFGLSKLLSGGLRGMFDGPSTVAVDWSGRGLVLDLSAVFHDPDALGIVMVAATGWLQSLLAAPDAVAVPRRYQVLEECWAILGDPATARYLQAAYKLSRQYGVVNIAVSHRISDLTAQADDGTSTAKMAMSLLADTQTRVLFCQSSDQIAQARDLLGLTEVEAGLLPRLVKGRALWRVAGQAAVVQHVIGPAETAICDTDARLTDPRTPK